MASLGVRDKIWWRKRSVVVLGDDDKRISATLGGGYCAFIKVGVGKDEHFESLCGYFTVQKLADLRPRVHSQQVCRPCLDNRCMVCNEVEMRQRKAKHPLPPSTGREP